MTIPRLLGRLSPRWRWAIHNIFAHPISEIFHQIGLYDLSVRVHDSTVPEVAE
jgi:hypothetical protein